MFAIIEHRQLEIHTMAQVKFNLAQYVRCSARARARVLSYRIFIGRVYRAPARDRRFDTRIPAICHVLLIRLHGN